MFVMNERADSNCNIHYPPDEFFDGIENGDQFVLPVELAVHDSESSRIYLLLPEGRKGLIGGFPRSIIAVDSPRDPVLRTWSIK
jgi:hypothetical protein